MWRNGREGNQWGKRKQVQEETTNLFGALEREEQVGGGGGEEI